MMKGISAALFPLDKEYFNIQPPITNLQGDQQPASNRHGIDGYLNDPIVAKPFTMR